MEEAVVIVLDSTGQQALASFFVPCRQESVVKPGDAGGNMVVLAMDKGAHAAAEKWSCEEMISGTRPNTDRQAYLQSFKKLLDASGQSSVYRSTTRSPLLVSSRTDISATASS